MEAWEKCFAAAGFWLEAAEVCWASMFASPQRQVQVHLRYDNVRKCACVMVGISQILFGPRENEIVLKVENNIDRLPAMYGEVTGTAVSQAPSADGDPTRELLLAGPVARKYRYTISHEPTKTCRENINGTRQR